MIFNLAPDHLIRACVLLGIASLVTAFLAGCGPETPQDPRNLLLSPDNISEMQLTVVSESEEQSVEGPSALVELQGPGFRVLQTVVLFASREEALSALDGIRNDLVSRGETGPGGMETSDILEHNLGSEEASSLFMIVDRVLARLTVTGPERRQRLAELAGIARAKLDGDDGLD